MRLFKFGGKFWRLDLYHWALPIDIEVNKFYAIEDLGDRDWIENGELHAVELRFSILCFHFEMHWELTNDNR